MATSHKKQKHRYLQRFCAMIFQKMLVLDNFWLLKASLNKEGGGYPPPPFHILNFKIFTKSKAWPFLELETRPGRHFLMVFTMFFARASIFYIKKCNFKNYPKIIKESICRWCLAVFGFRPSLQTSSSPGPFLTVFAMFYAHRALFKNEPFFASGGGRRHLARPTIAKAKATPHACGAICPASDALCIAGFKTGWRCGRRPG